MASLTEVLTEVDAHIAYLSALKDKVFHGEEKRLLIYTLEFIEWDVQTISSHQQTCKGNREWKSAELLKLKEKWWEERWKMIEKVVGKEKTVINPIQK